MEDFRFARKTELDPELAAMKAAAAEMRRKNEFARWDDVPTGDHSAGGLQAGVGGFLTARAIQDTLLEEDSLLESGLTGDLEMPWLQESNDDDGDLGQWSAMAQELRDVPTPPQRAHRSPPSDDEKQHGLAEVRSHVRVGKSVPLSHGLHAYGHDANEVEIVHKPTSTGKGTANAVRRQQAVQLLGRGEEPGLEGLSALADTPNGSEDAIGGDNIWQGEVTVTQVHGMASGRMGVRHKSTFFDSADGLSPLPNGNDYSRGRASSSGGRTDSPYGHAGVGPTSLGLGPGRGGASFFAGSTAALELDEDAVLAQLDGRGSSRRGDVSSRAGSEDFRGGHARASPHQPQPQQRGSQDYATSSAKAAVPDYTSFSKQGKPGGPTVYGSGYVTASPPQMSAQALGPAVSAPVAASAQPMSQQEVAAMYAGRAPSSATHAGIVYAGGSIPAVSATPPGTVATIVPSAVTVAQVGPKDISAAAAQYAAMGASKPGIKSQFQAQMEAQARAEARASGGPAPAPAMPVATGAPAAWPQTQAPAQAYGAYSGGYSTAAPTSYSPYGAYSYGPSPAAVPASTPGPSPTPAVPPQGSPAPAQAPYNAGPAYSVTPVPYGGWYAGGTSGTPQASPPNYYGGYSYPSPAGAIGSQGGYTPTRT